MKNWKIIIINRRSIDIYKIRKYQNNSYYVKIINSMFNFLNEELLVIFLYESIKNF